MWHGAQRLRLSNGFVLGISEKQRKIIANPVKSVEEDKLKFNAVAKVATIFMN